MASRDTSAIRLVATRLCSLAASVILLAGAMPSAHAEPRFKHHFIDKGGPEGDIFSNTALGDLDKDGRLDVIVGRSRYGKGPRNIYWYRNQGRIDAWQGPLVLVSGVSCGCGGAVLDVDRDGWPDFVDGCWYRNPGRLKPGVAFEPTWTIHGGHDTEAADLDGDGRPEILVHTQQGKPGVYVYHAGPAPSKRWEETRALAVPVTSKGNRGLVHAAVAPRGFGDLDGDGDADIAFNGSWLENLDGKARRWKEHRNLPGFTRSGPWGRAVRCWVVDMDKDGHMDVVQSECDMPNARVAWFENVRGDGSQWTMHPLPNDCTPGDFHSLAVADFDLDGDWDVYVDEMEHLHVPKGREGAIGMIVWENRDGKGANWTKHVLVSGLGGHQAQIADLDGDGDVDIVTRPYKPAHNAIGGRMHVSVLENLARNPNATGPGSGIGPDTAASAPPPTPAEAAPPKPAANPTVTNRTANLRDGLVARWTFDDLPGNVATFDADHGRVEAGPLDVPGAALTVAARVKAESFTGSGHDGRILSKAVGIQEQDHYWMLSTWRVGRTTRLRFRLKTGGKTDTLIADAGDVQTGVWTHVAAVYDGQTMRLYADGRLVGSRPKSGSIDTSPQVPVWIGDNPPDPGSRPWHGLIDDVGIWGRAFDADQVRGLHQASPP